MIKFIMVLMIITNVLEMLIDKLIAKEIAMSWNYQKQVTLKEKLFLAGSS